ncbi:cytochrome P450 [Isoptericola hypogeus]|uniref:Cytochrome P450 n=1 Tax=Isoptericola hypogeus TaxID=300179 RepID=A0ABP4W0F7_9MICO
MTSAPPVARAPVDLTPAEAARVVRSVLAPLVAQGAVVRRPRMTAWAERRQSDRTARTILAGLRERYDGAPLVLRVGTRRLVVVTHPDDVRRLLAGTPDPFTPASEEKRGALAHFQPDGVLISPPEDRSERRPFNEAVLQADRPVHDDGAAFVDAVARATGRLAETARATGRLDASSFADAWWSVVLEVVLGPGARDDRRLVDVLGALRRDGNWSWLRPRRPWLRRELDRRVESYLHEPAPGSLADGVVALGGPAAAGQVPHWLFAFDAAGAATLRALAVASARPAVRDRLRDEWARAGAGPALLPYARACVLESVRLWPTTLAILRESSRPTRWDDRTLPAGSGFVVVSSFFHRDTERLPDADSFVPEGWLDGRHDADWGLVPFSGGPASCPGRNLVLLVASHGLARLAELDLHVARGRYLERDPLPCTMDHLGLRFGLRPGRVAGPARRR